MSYLIKLNNVNNLQKLIGLTSSSFKRLISNSHNNQTTTSPKVSADHHHVEAPVPTIDGVKPWMSHGYDFKDKTYDRDVSKATFFFSVTICLVWGTFVWSYLPDPQGRDWAQREAFIELKRRELCGCSLIDPNFIDPADIVLPKEDELCDVEIII